MGIMQLAEQALSEIESISAEDAVARRTAVSWFLSTCAISARSRRAIRSPARTMRRAA